MIFFSDIISSICQLFQGGDFFFQILSPAYVNGSKVVKLIVLLQSCNCLCSWSLPGGTDGWSVIVALIVLAPRLYFFMLNSNEHDDSNAHKN